MKLWELLRMVVDEDYYWESPVNHDDDNESNPNASRDNNNSTNIKSSASSSTNQTTATWCHSLRDFVETARKLTFRTKWESASDSDTERNGWILHSLLLDDEDEQEDCIETTDPSSKSHSESISSLTPPDGNYLLYKGMNPKKILEVTLLSRMIASTARKCHTRRIIDIGSGKGYLSHVLAVEHDMKVIGIDCDRNVVDHSNKRAEKYEGYTQVKESKRKTKCPHPHQKNPSRKRKQKSSQKKFSGSLRALCSHIDSNMKCSDFIQLLKQEEKLSPEMENSPHLLIGLHTCGNLASTTLRFFVNSEAKSVVNVGCCYHKLLEKSDPALNGDTERIGYPLSSYVKQLDFELTSGIRDLGCLALSQWDWKDVSHATNVFTRQSFRWVLDAFLVARECTPKKENSSIFTVGSLPAKRTTTFGNYAYEACHKMISKDKINAPESLGDVVSDKERFIADMEEYYKSFNPTQEGYIHSVAVWWCLRAMVASISEEMILLDRVLYLRENNCEAELYRVFPPDISPRGYVLVGKKKE